MKILNMNPEKGSEPSPSNEEVALTQAFVVERAHGKIVGYNCKVANANGVVTVTPYEKIVNSIHFNFRKGYKASVNCIDRPVLTKDLSAGMHWLKQDNKKPEKIKGVAGDYKR